jgi:hypothetical protein
MHRSGGRASGLDTSTDAPSLWRAFVRSFALCATATAVAFYGFIVALDPYGLRAAPGRAPAPIMDLNQRYMYPQIVRSGSYDAAVFGTSTIRLLDPERLGALFEARFANLGLNAGTPWEQMRLAALFLRHVPHPKALIFGIDPTWCELDADAPGKRVTARTFPPWLYDGNRLNDYPELLNLRSLEIAGRVALNRLGLMPPRIRGDGYEVFVPPESAYDLVRARARIWNDADPNARPEDPPVTLTPDERAALRFPTLPWLDDLLRRVPAGVEVTLAFPPIHVALQPRAGSRQAAVDEACKAAIAVVGARHGAAVVDFRIPSAVTREDSNYWDPLHYRVGIAERIAGALKDARATGRDDPEGFYRVLAPAAAR